MVDEDDLKWVTNQINLLYISVHYWNMRFHDRNSCKNF